jgi:hypothetical protein
MPSSTEFGGLSGHATSNGSTGPQPEPNPGHAQPAVITISTQTATFDEKEVTSLSDGQNERAITTRKVLYLGGWIDDEI